MVVNMFERKWSTNYHMFNLEGNLLVLVYVHNIPLAFHLHLALSLVMPCTLVHSFVFFNNVYKKTSNFSNLQTIWALIKFSPHLDMASWSVKQNWLVISTSFFIHWSKWPCKKCLHEHQDMSPKYKWVG
jgi:hypothetical protein